MEAAAGGGFGLLHGIFWEDVRDFRDQACGSEGFFDVVAFEIDIGIDFVCKAVVALIFFEADVVSGGADPKSSAIEVKWGFPNAQMVSRRDDGDGFGVG